MPTPSPPSPDPARDRLLRELARRAGLIGPLWDAADGDGRSVAERLFEDGTLSSTEAATLAALATEHLDRAGGDADRALADLATTPDTVVWPESDAAATTTGAADEPGPGAAGAGGAGPAGGRRFTILRSYDGGNQGLVFVALDHEVGREVALKRINASLAGRAAARERFVREAQITGRLQHPGIVPVYSLGHGPDGLPFYAMRLVAGDTLRQAIDRARGRPVVESPGAAAAATPAPVLSLRQLISRCVALCQTVAYAHGQGVLHRDLKPSNLVLGAHGESFVLDWGLARQLDGAWGAADAGEGGSGGSESGAGSGDGSATEPGSLLGSPAYMSPEQASGVTTGLTPASDVSSLGATLYHVLVGQPPFRGHRDAVLAAVRAGRFPPPKEIEPTVDPALEAVCLKAMALRPEDRYPSAEALAADLERWLADEPVTAWREPWERRLDRWARRHRTLVVSTGLLLATATAALAIGGALLRLERDAAIAARDRATQAEAQTLAASRQVEASYAIASAAVDAMLVRIGDDGLARSPGLERVRRDVAEVAVAQGRQLLAARPDDPRTLRDVAAIFQRAGNLHRFFDAEPAAGALFDEAIGWLDAGVARFPNSPELGSELASLLRDRSHLRLRHDGPRAAEPDAERAVAVAQALHDRTPGHLGHRRTLGMNLESAAVVRLMLGRSGPARAGAEAGAGHLLAVARSPIASPVDRMFAVGALTVQATAERALGDAGAARATIAAAVALGREDAAHDVGLGDHRLLLALALAEQARGLDAPEARARLDEAVGLLEAIVAGSPSQPLYRRALAEVLTLRGALGAPATPAAVADLERALGLLEALDRESPGTFAYDQRLGRVLAERGARLAETGPADAARATLEQALARLDAADAAGSRHPDDQAARTRARAALDRLATGPAGPP